MISLPALTLKGVVNPFVREMVTNVNTKYLAALRTPAAEPWVDEVCGFTSTNAHIEKFPVDLTQMEGFRRWVGERQIKRSDLTGFVIEQDRWEQSLGWDVDRARRGEFGNMVDKSVAMLLGARRMRARLAAMVLKAGKDKAKTYQGIPLFVGSGAGVKHWYNPLDGSKGDFYNLRTNKPFTPDTYEEARIAHAEVKGPEGEESLGLELTHLLGGTKMEPVFNRVIKKRDIANTAGTASETNIWEGSAKVLKSSLLDSDPVVVAGGQVWYSIAANQVAKPVEIIAANDGEPEIVVLGEESEYAALNNEILLLGKLLANAGAALPQTIFRWEFTP